MKKAKFLTVAYLRAFTLVLSIILTGCQKESLQKNEDDNTEEQEVNFSNMRKSQSSLVSVPSIKDVDGNKYLIKKIGSHWWILENLKVTHYRNGDAILNVPNINTANWNILTQGAMTDIYPTYSNEYGYLYNNYAVHDSRKIAPTGWHVASETDWADLEAYLGGGGAAVNALCEQGNVH